METTKKYELLVNDTIQHEGRTLFRIKALRCFSYVNTGNLGGYIESEDNLSHEGNCWIDDEAKVYHDARVFGNAQVYDEAEVFDQAKVYGDAFVNDRSKVYDNAEVFGETWVYGYARVIEYAKVYGNSGVLDNATISGHAQVRGNVRVCGAADISQDAVVETMEDYIIFKNWWSSGRTFTWTKSNNMWSVGCFRGTGEELIAKAYKDSEKSGQEYERVVKYVESMLESMDQNL